MKHLLACILLVIAPSARAADVAGLWATPKNGGRVEISRCGQSLCGRLVSSDDIEVDPGFPDVNNRDRSLRGRPLKGLLILHGFGGGPGRWTGGKVYNPEDGATYSGSLELVGDDRLRLKGCIVVPLCRSQAWTRVK